MEKIVEFPLPEREYYVAPKKGRKRRRRPLAVSVLLGALLFAGGFLLGKAGAVPVGEAVPTDGTPVHVLCGAGGASAAGIVPEPLAAGGPQGGEEDWALRLVNGENPLPADFTIPKLTQLRNGHAIDSRAYPALQAMMDDCRAAGLQPLICSSYRTREKQTELFENKVTSLLNQGFSTEDADAQAAVWVARPGTSEHETGLAVDIVDVGYQLLDRHQEETEVQQWLMAHCAEYGFILRYPTEKSGVTGIGYEPWHYRYVGEAAAREIMEQGLCLEEYLA